MTDEEKKTRRWRTGSEAWDWLFIVVEVAFVLAGLYGISLIYFPAALVVGGALGVYSMELTMRANAALRTKAAK